MRLNSPEQLETASRLIQEFGSWSNVRNHCFVNKHGVYVLKVPPRDIDNALQKFKSRLIM